MVVDEDSTLAVDLGEINAFFDGYISIANKEIKLKMAPGSSSEGSASTKASQSSSSAAKTRTIKLKVLEDFEEADAEE